MKKLSALLLIVVLIFTMVACSSNSNKNNNESTPTTETETATNTETPTTTPPAEKVKLTLVMKDEGPSNEVAVQFFDLLEQGLAEEGIYVDIELLETPAGNYAEKLNLMLLGGTIPDLIYFQGGDQQIAQQGLLEDLRPYIEKSTYIKDSLEPHNKKRLDNYPYLLWIKPLNSKVPVVRGDWFSQLETAKTLEADPSIDNYYAFLKEIKDKGLAGSSVTVAGDIVELDQIFEQAFGNTATWVKDDSGKYVYNRVSNFEKEKLAFYAKLYKEGILDPEFLTKQWDTKEQAFYDNHVGLVVGTAGKVIDLYDGKMKKANGDSSSLHVLPPAKGIGQGYLPVDVTKEARGMAISTVSKHKEVAFKVLDYLASPKGQLLDRLGFENEHYTVSGNSASTTEKAQEWYARFWEPSKLNIGMDLATPLLGNAGADSLTLANKYYTENTSFLIPEEYIANWDAMQNLYKEYSADIITNKKPVSDFDKFVSEWYKAGGTEITEYANKTLK